MIVTSCLACVSSTLRTRHGAVDETVAAAAAEDPLPRALPTARCCSIPRGGGTAQWMAAALTGNTQNTRKRPRTWSANFLNAAGGHDYAPVCELLVQSNPSLLVEV